VSGARSRRPYFSCEEDQRRSDHAGAAQQTEAIEKAKECRLPLNDSRQLHLCMESRVRRGKTVRHKMSRQRAKRFLIALLGWSGVSNQN